MAFVGPRPNRTIPTTTIGLGTVSSPPWEDDEPLPNIAALVKEHAVAAWSLAQLERLPPGYSLWEWAAYLMDLEPKALRIRLVERVQTDTEGFVGDITALMGSASGSDLMTVPDRAPVELLPKMRELDAKWKTELVHREAVKALSRFVGVKRDKEAMKRIEVALRVAINRVKQRVGELPVKTSFSMTARGEFKLKMWKVGTNGKA